MVKTRRKGSFPALQVTAVVLGSAIDILCLMMMRKGKHRYWPRLKCNDDSALDTAGSSQPRQGTLCAYSIDTTFICCVIVPGRHHAQLRASVCYCLLHHALPNLERKEISRAQIIRLCECLKVKSYAGNRHETIMHPLDEPRCWSRSHQGVYVAQDFGMIAYMKPGASQTSSKHFQTRRSRQG